jgi:RNA polymerase sigma factor (sigma-70 family)
MRDNVRSEEQLTVEELLEMCAKRPPDQASWQEFVRQYDLFIRAAVTRTFQRKHRRDPDRTQQFRDDLVDDLVQAVYVRLFGKGSRPLPSPRREYPLLQYLSIVSSNVVRDYFREFGALKRPKVTFSLDELLEGSGDPHARREVRELVDPTPTSDRVLLARDEVDRALQQAVSPRNRQRDTLIFKLHYYDELTVAEIRVALNLELSLESIGILLKRIKEKLKSQFEGIHHTRASAPEFPGLLTRMQKPSARQGMQAAFNASPGELGRAAVKEARKRR